MKTVPGAMTALLVPRLDEPLHRRIKAAETLLRQPITGARFLFLVLRLDDLAVRILRQQYIIHDPIKTNFVTVVLTAYDDEGSIKAAVRDFQSHPLIRRVVVTSNSISQPLVH